MVPDKKKIQQEEFHQGEDTEQQQPSNTVFPFDVVVVTFPDEGAAHVASGGPLQDLQAIYPQTRFLATCDPLGCRCGSGGGTLAALEQVESEIGNAQTKTILILHAGGDSSRCFTQMALGKAWTSLPLVDHATGKEILSNPIHVGMDSIARIFSQSHCLPKGSVVIAASDALLSIPHYKATVEEQTIELGASEHGSDKSGPIFPEVLGVAFPTPWETAKNHGVYVLAELEQPVETPQEARALEVPIRKVLQKPTLKTLQEKPFVTFGNVQKTKGLAWIDNGIIAFLPRAAKSLHELARGVLQTTTKNGLLRSFEERHPNEPELTYQDVTHKVDLYTHFLQALTIAGEPGQVLSTEQRRENYLKDHASDLDTKVALGIFDALSPFQFMSLAIPAGKFLHLGTTRELLDFYVYGCRRSATSQHRQGETPNFTNASRHELYTHNCTYFGQDLGMIRRMDVFARWNEESTGTREESTPQVPYIGKDCVLMGSILEGAVSSQIGEGTVIEFCSLEKFPQHGPLSINIGKNCLVSGLRQAGSGSSKLKTYLMIPNDTCVQMMPLTVDNTAYHEPFFVLMTLGVNDPIKKPLSDSTVFGMKMEDFLTWADLTPEDVWDPSVSRTIWNAKLHPVASKASGTSFIQLWDWVNYLPTTNGVAITEEAQVSLNCWKSHSRLLLCQIRDQSDAAEEFRYRHDLVHKRIPTRQHEHCRRIAEMLKQRNHNECDFYPLLTDTLKSDKGETGNTFVSSQATHALHTLDAVIQSALLEQHQYDVCGRTLMVESALLDGLSKAMFSRLQDDEKPTLSTEIQARCSSLLQAIESPLSSGPDRQKAYTEIVTLREDYLAANVGSPGLLKMILSEFSEIMEAIARIMTEICVAGFLIDNATIWDKHRRQEAVIDQWAVATAPARVDLAGGWSDTPPVCYEYGSAVTGMAVTVDGKKPLSCRCRIVSCGDSSQSTSDNGIIFMRSELRDNKSCHLTSALDIKLHTLNDLRDARDPTASCALIKCALICLGLISVEALQHDQPESSTHNLQGLVNAFCRSKEGNNVRMEIVVTSLLPQGSGMGTSSILGGCILAAVGHCIGIAHSTDVDQHNSGESADIIDSVSALEQILSTGGGFQDQVNGLIGGFKTVSSQACQLPIRLTIERQTVAPTFQKKLDERLLLAFTGKTRLAKNILQNVLRRWARRTPEVVATVQGLVTGAHKAKEALQQGDLEGLGECLHDYYAQKKNMAGKDSGVEPDIVAGILEELRKENLIRGASLCGAGGGGFLVMMILDVSLG